MNNEIKLSYDERKLVTAVRKMVHDNPAKAVFLVEGMSRGAAVALLLQAKKEMDDLLAVSRAFSEAAAKLAALDKSNLRPEQP